MKYGISICLLLALYFPLASAAKNTRHDRELQDEQIALQCEGDFDQPPVLVKGRAPLTPISALMPNFAEDRWVRNLPLRWEMQTTFQVSTDGKTSGMRTTRTDPPTFAGNMNAAVKEWRFQPASLAGQPVAVTCTTAFSMEVLR